MSEVTPDYAAIDWVLENVEGARPEKHIDGMNVRLYRREVNYRPKGFTWLWECDSPQIVRHERDTTDALAILRDWWTLSLLNRSYVTVEAWAENNKPAFAASSSGLLATHPDRTTAIALLVRRVYEAGKDKA